LGSNIFTFGEALNDPEARRKLKITQEDVDDIQKDKVSGFAQTTPSAPAIAYNPTEATSVLTVLHEAGHVGAAAVQAEAQRDPNIFKRYAFRRNPAEPGEEEKRQRVLDVAVAGKLKEKGLITESGAYESSSRAISYVEEHGSKLTGEEIRERTRHGQMYEQRAREMLSREGDDRRRDISGGSELDKTATPTVNAKGKLSVDAKAPEGVTVKAESEGNVFDKTELNRQTPMLGE
jgi:hypothetical protein